MCRDCPLPRYDELVHQRKRPRTSIDAEELEDLLRKAAAELKLPQFASSKILGEMAGLIVRGEV
jgi:hypothetical protein